ncbi:energy-coupling factor transporter transmembrane component T [Citricoccus sp. SGAir0253]|uniref:energy-coupling factor transporter transmembrane component T n=1 Tax=Citricoccus sp. SGAir0253 TaxID=2567881 RepID=UPI00143DC060|nr:energy-coupling factor transporter transmembrane component T [Citricoccus sp. SGAir0253]
MNLLEHRPGDSPVHRAPLGLKYLVLLAVSVTLVLWREPVVVAPVLALVAGLHVLAGLPRELLAPWRRGWPLLVFAGLARWASGAWGPAGLPPLEAVGPALVVVAAVFGALAAARLLVITTPGTELLDGLARFFGAFRRLGVDPEAAALAVNVMLRSIPWVGAAVRAQSEALAARGLRRGPVRLMGPVLVATVGHARATGEALAARGLPAAPETGARHHPGAEAGDYTRAP